MNLGCHWGRVELGTPARADILGEGKQVSIRNPRTRNSSLECLCVFYFLSLSSEGKFFFRNASLILIEPRTEYVFVSCFPVALSRKGKEGGGGLRTGEGLLTSGDPHPCAPAPGLAWALTGVGDTRL